MDKKISRFQEYFMQGCKTGRLFNIGLEVEHFVLNKETCRPMAYEGLRGVGALMEALSSDYPQKHMEDGALISLESDDILITLEPGCQIEISTAPYPRVERIMKLYHEARQGIEDQLAPLGFGMYTEGYLPCKKAADVMLISKERYRCMNDYFQKSGIYGIHMMRATAACHVSIDYFDEEDFVMKYRLAWLLNPLLALLTENVSRFEDRPFKGHLLRDTIWQGVDKARVSPCTDMFDEGFGFASYARWLLDVPVIVVNQGDSYKYEPELSIGDCMDVYGSSEDLLRHYLSMTFPDVRLKQFIEIRSADSMPEEYVAAYCCLVKGIFSDRKTAERILAALPHSIEAIEDAKGQLRAKGFEAKTYGRESAELLGWILKEAGDNLDGAEAEAIKLWQPLISQKTNMQGVNHS